MRRKGVICAVKADCKVDMMANCVRQSWVL